MVVPGPLPGESDIQPILPDFPIVGVYPDRVKFLSIKTRDLIYQRMPFGNNGGLLFLCR
jgi:hypothetical protein